LLTGASGMQCQKRYDRNAVTMKQTDRQTIKQTDYSGQTERQLETMTNKQTDRQKEFDR